MEQELIYAIGDIHGRLDLLNRLLGKIEMHADGRPHRLIFLGDYVDRGPFSKQVIDLLMGLQKQDLEFEPVFLKGNHEQAVLQMMDQDFYWTSLHDWMKKYGGDATLSSYGIYAGNGKKNVSRICKQFKEAVGEDQYNFLKNLPLSFETDHYFLCHAGVDFDRPLDRQTGDDLMWIRKSFTDSAQKAAKIIVHGHTITPHHKPEILPNRIGIDTGAYRSGRLTACALHGSDNPEFIMT